MYVFCDAEFALIWRFFPVIIMLDLPRRGLRRRRLPVLLPPRLVLVRHGALALGVALALVPPAPLRPEDGRRLAATAVAAHVVQEAALHVAQLGLLVAAAPPRLRVGPEALGGGRGVRQQAGLDGVRCGLYKDIGNVITGNTYYIRLKLPNGST